MLGRSLPGSPADLANRDRLDLLAFRFYLALQESIDLASHLVADEGWGPAPSLRAHFEILGRNGVLGDALARDMADGVKVRNLIGHAYVTIDAERLLAAAQALRPKLERYCAAVLAYAEAQSPPKSSE